MFWEHKGVGSSPTLRTIENKNVSSSNGLGFNALNVVIPVRIWSTRRKHTARTALCLGALQCTVI